MMRRFHSYRRFKRGGVVELVGLDRFDEADVVHDVVQRGEGLGNFHAALAVSAEFVRGFEDVAGLFIEMHFKIATGIRFAGPFVQLGFLIEQIHLARTAMLEKANDGFGFSLRLICGEQSRGTTEEN